MGFLLFTFCLYQRHTKENIYKYIIEQNGHIKRCENIYATEVTDDVR
jgi:hypothetical protein